MYQKKYSDYLNAELSEKEIEQQEEILNAFIRVEQGRSVNVNDLRIVTGELSKLTKNRNQQVNLKDVISNLEKEVVLRKNNVSFDKHNQRKKRVERERRERNRRLTHEKRVSQDRTL